MNVDELVKQYIHLRDTRNVLRREFEEKVGRIDTVLEQVEGVLLKMFQDTGMDSVKTASGTAYKQVRTSASVADWDTFWKFVEENKAYELLEQRCNKKAVQQYRAANDDLPPGINWREEVVVNFRRAAETIEE